MKHLLWIPLLAVPLVVHDNVVLTILVFTFIAGILAVSFNLIFGFTGQLSLFHAAAFGLSALIASSATRFRAIRRDKSFASPGIAITFS